MAALPSGPGRCSSLQQRLSTHSTPHTSNDPLLNMTNALLAAAAAACRCRSYPRLEGVLDWLLSLYKFVFPFLVRATAAGWGRRCCCPSLLSSLRGRCILPADVCGVLGLGLIPHCTRHGLFLCWPQPRTDRPP